MHKITMYENLRDKIDSEISEIEKKGITNDNLDHLYKLSMSLKAVDKHIECLEEIKEMEENGGEYSNGYPYYSYRDGRMSRAARRRNAMGQYSRNYPYFRDYNDEWSMDGSSYASRNRGSNYSRDDAKRKMVQKLETLKDDTMSEHEREAIQDCINRIGV